MKVSDKNYESLWIDYVEQSLDKETEKALLDFLQEHPELREIVDSYDPSLTLEPNEAISFPDKTLLLHHANRKKLFPWIVYGSVAAIVLLLVSIGLHFFVRSHEDMSAPYLAENCMEAETNQVFAQSIVLGKLKGADDHIVDAKQPSVDKSLGSKDEKLGEEESSSSAFEQLQEDTPKMADELQERKVVVCENQLVAYVPPMLVAYENEERSYGLVVYREPQPKHPTLIERIAEMPLAHDIYQGVSQVEEFIAHPRKQFFVFVKEKIKPNTLKS